MATETNPAEATETETPDNETPEATATETEQVTAQDSPAEPADPKDIQLPADHPLVKTLTAHKEELKQLRPTAQRVAELETQVSELTDKATSAETAQAKYDRLEAFLTSLGGPISKALDSKSFSTALFESDTDIKELVAQWHKDNPSATSAALNSGNGTTTGASDMNALLRKAAR